MEKNKGRRNEITQLKWKKRLKNLNLPISDKRKYTCFKAQGKPCGCFGCKPPKYKRATKHKNSVM